MRWALYIFGVCLVVGSAFWSYRMTYGTQDMMDAVRALRAEIRAEREAIAVLEAEWAWMNAPARLEALAEAHRPRLALRPMTPDRFADLAEVAEPPVDDGLEPVALIDLDEVGAALSLAPRPTPRPADLAPPGARSVTLTGAEALFDEVFR